MRTLILLIVGLIVFAAILVSNRIAARRQSEAGDGPSDDSLTLEARLAEAATVFAAAAQASGRPILKSTVSDLAAQCSALARREGEGAGFNRESRSAIIRLLLVLHDVVERVMALERHGVPESGIPLFNSAIDLVGRATAELHAIADRADARALTHLEADLEILRERLDTES